ncbi:flagellar biosynthesis protein FlhA [bacterium]|nr:flagellar biosynthesis protein FlhA [bacterium]MDB4703244.1 flagellar biosynthesis protein FlhA [bacterium]
MAEESKNIKRVWDFSDLALVFFMFGTLLVLIIPVHQVVMDMLLGVSLALALLILLVILFIKNPSDFTGFPTLLLIFTLYRLGLNVATTRLILSEANAGELIDAFGEIVVSGSFVVGIVIFLILTVINFVVITKGAGRIAEVAARFTLDAMPGKQLSIDAELDKGHITVEEAIDKRRLLQQESDFYGAMDGASKFVRGDAVAAILVTLVNIVGGLAIGVFENGMPVGEALETYTRLTIGDGLLTQVPAIVTSTAAGVLVTRAASREELGQSLGKQLFFSKRAMAILCGTMLVMAIVPGFPMLPFLTLASVFGFIAYGLREGGILREAFVEMDKEDAANKKKKDAKKQAEAGGPDEALESLLQVDTLMIELGYGLVGLADPAKGGDLLQRITGVRKSFAQEMGFIVPSIRLRDSLKLSPNQYQFLMRGQVISQGEVMPGHWMAMNTANSSVVLKGVPTTEPVFKLPATWVDEVERRNAEMAGYTVVDSSSVMVTHLSESIRRHSYQILTRQDVQVLLDNLKDDHPALINELIPNMLNIGQIQRILQNLLAEVIPIRNLVGILERVADHAAATKNPDELSEQARRVLGPEIVRPFLTDENEVQAVTMEPWLEEEIAKGLQKSATESVLFMEPKLAQHMTHHLATAVQPMIGAGQQPVVLCSTQVRLGLRRFFASNFPEIAFVAYEELPPKVAIQSTTAIPGMP